jgi:GNAT superfamily N-acetyltransferase
MVASDNLNPEQFTPLLEQRLRPEQFGAYDIQHNPLKYRHVEAIHRSSGRKVGQLIWEKAREDIPPTVASVDVLTRHRRKGVASAMLEHARQYEPDLAHSHARTPDGRAWTAARP